VKEIHGPPSQATRKPDDPQGILDSALFTIEDYFPGQCPGEHIGAGAPPSANDAVDIAPSNTSVASIRRAIFFMIKISQGIELPREATIFFWTDEN
jgi:hypothetical protein